MVPINIWKVRSEKKMMQFKTKVLYYIVNGFLEKGDKIWKAREIHNTDTYQCIFKIKVLSGLNKIGLKSVKFVYLLG